MTELRLPLVDTDFQRLSELGRSQIPVVAPDWTDHNIHDPGIMLIELLAWVADAQIFALGRTRRDERWAYAGLLGITPRGPEPATGLIWPPYQDPRDTTPLWTNSTVVEKGTPVTPDYPDAAPFRTTETLTLTTARLIRVSTRRADGTTSDWTAANSQRAPTFRPFGGAPRFGDRLVLDFNGKLVSNFESETVVSIGVEIVQGNETAYLDSDDVSTPIRPTRLRVAIEDSAGERDIRLESDTTKGLIRSGLLLLHISARQAPIDKDFSITIRSAGGSFLRSPRIRRIAPNVLPVEQSEAFVPQFPQIGTAQPGQVCTLEEGLVKPPNVRIAEAGGYVDWEAADDLQSCGPEDHKYAFDSTTRILRFGNGVNGAMPAQNATIDLKYDVSQGARGNLPDGVRWSVKGTPDVSWENAQPVSGGKDGIDLAMVRAVARKRSREARPLVTGSDLEEAALSFSDLGVARVFEVPPDRMSARRVRGSRLLVVVGTRDAEEDSLDVAETPVWLEEIRARLARRLPLGQRLEVIAPRYVEVRISATLVAVPNVKLDEVRQAAATKLKKELATVAARPGDKEWPFGRDLSLLAVKGWLRSVPDVAKVVEARLTVDGREIPKKAALEPTSLPKLRIEAEDMGVERWPAGAPR